MLRLTLFVLLSSLCSFATNNLWTLNENFDEKDIRMHKRFEITNAEKVVNQIDFIHEDEFYKIAHFIKLRIWFNKELDGYDCLFLQINNLLHDKIICDKKTEKQTYNSGNVIMLSIEIPKLTCGQEIMQEIIKIIEEISTQINMALSDEIKNELLDLGNFKYLSEETLEYYNQVLDEERPNRRG